MFVERETSISLREYFSENTVKPREKERDGEDRRWFLALGIIASGSAAKSLTKAPNGGEGAGLTPTEAECRL